VFPELSPKVPKAISLREFPQSPSERIRAVFIAVNFRSVLRSACRIDKDELMNKLPECRGRGKCTIGDNLYVYLNRKLQLFESNLGVSTIYK
jgi:hypothetical protein